ncbi:hypothetical protein [Streptomyces megasporus]|uniref:hypothetical protein n=1 Tax=Streptomyces megasporus TaxID=44060 RepID=UPI0004E1A78B|nr:hypothetical protein [Streptomyces megasporus]
MGAAPTPLVTRARAARRTAAVAWSHGESDVIERFNALISGAYVWVPDDDRPGPAAARLAQLPVHWLADWTLCLDVECGPRPDTVLHRLYGAVTAFEAEAGLEFSPTGGHPPIVVPVHRIVALTGDRHRHRRFGEVPAHEPYDEHEPAPEV